MLLHAVECLNWDRLGLLAATPSDSRADKAPTLLLRLRMLASVSPAQGRAAEFLSVWKVDEQQGHLRFRYVDPAKWVVADVSRGSLRFRPRTDVCGCVHLHWANAEYNVCDKLCGDG